MSRFKLTQSISRRLKVEMLAAMPDKQPDALTDHNFGKCPGFTMIGGIHPAGAGCACDGRALRGTGSQSCAPRVSLYLGPMVVCCGPADRDLLSVLKRAVQGRG